MHTAQRPEIINKVARASLAKKERGLGSRSRSPKKLYNFAISRSFKAAQSVFYINILATLACPLATR